MLIDIKPLDTLFFRDGKPFSMGDNDWADGIFPPHPSVFYGALRSAYIGKNIDCIGKISNKSDPDDPTQKLKILNIFKKKNLITICQLQEILQLLLLRKKKNFSNLIS